MWFEQSASARPSPEHEDALRRHGHCDQSGKCSPFPEKDATINRSLIFEPS